MLQISKCKVAPKSLAHLARQFVHKLGPDDAVPFDEFIEKLGLTTKHGHALLCEMKARIVLIVDGKQLSCVVHPDVAKKLRGKQA